MTPCGQEEHILRSQYLFKAEGEEGGGDTKKTEKYSWLESFAEANHRRKRKALLANISIEGSYSSVMPNPARIPAVLDLSSPDIPETFGEKDGKDLSSGGVQISKLGGLHKNGRFVPPRPPPASR